MITMEGTHSSRVGYRHSTIPAHTGRGGFGRMFVQFGKLYTREVKQLEITIEVPFEHISAIQRIYRLPSAGASERFIVRRIRQIIEKFILSMIGSQDYAYV